MGAPRREGNERNRKSPNTVDPEPDPRRSIKLPDRLFARALLAQEQEAAEEEEVLTAEEVVLPAADEEPEADELIVVTGSRLKRDTFSSIAPLQIITAEVSREAGLIDAGDILRASTAAGGQQVDLTFQGYVLDNGPGSTDVSLRGLGANRTLILINGRRMSPAGLEGAPVNPDAGLIPGSLVAQLRPAARRRVVRLRFRCHRRRRQRHPAQGFRRLRDRRDPRLFPSTIRASSPSRP